jgi:hypothetical protein
LADGILETSFAGLRATLPRSVEYQQKGHGRKNSGRGFIEKRWRAPVGKAVKQRPHRGIDAKTESRGGVHTIVFSRSWLNAFVFGVRLAWLPLSHLA